MVTGFLEDIFRKYSGIFHSLMDVKGDLNVITVKLHENNCNFSLLSNKLCVSNFT